MLSARPGLPPSLQAGRDDGVGDFRELGGDFLESVPLAALGVDGALGVGVVDLVGEVPPELDGLAEDAVHIDLEQVLLRVRGVRVDVLPLELPDMGQAEERVAVEDLVVDEGERELRVQRHEPQ